LGLTDLECVDWVSWNWLPFMTIGAWFLRSAMRMRRKSQSNRIYAGELSGAEVETCWQQENIAGTETGRKQIS
jgi:hypothetical protein